MLLAGNDALTIIFALCGLLVGSAWLRYHTVTVRKDSRYHPRLLRLSRSLETNL
jgi:positive regulator of sigma E activity